MEFCAGSGMGERRGVRLQLLSSPACALISVSDSFLGYVDLLGTTYTSPALATGYGAHIALPLMRKATESKGAPLTREEAEQTLLTSLKVLFYRDARSINKVCKHGSLYTVNSHYCC